MNAPAAFAKFMTDSVDSEVAPPPTPYVAGDWRRGGRGKEREERKEVSGRNERDIWSGVETLKERRGKEEGKKTEMRNYSAIGYFFT